MSTSIDGDSPSMRPGPEDDGAGDDYDAGYDLEGNRVGDRDDDLGPEDSGAVWLHEEIQRRIAAGRRASKGRHSRHEVASSTTSISYVPRHSTATPGPGALPPEPVSTPARGLPRVPAAWSSPDPTTRIPPVRPTAGPGATPDARPAAEGPAPRVEGHRRTMLAGGVAKVPVDDQGAPPPYRSGDLHGVRKARLDAVPIVPGDPDAPDPDPHESMDSRRVRVVLSERRGGARPVRTVVDVQEGTGVGELLRSNLIGAQLAVALRFAVGTALALGALPVLFAVFPEIGRTELLGLRVPWLLLGLLVYPFLVLVGLWHTRTAERVEQNFADHVQD
ncbi:hypothetical protein [Pseudonocardia lacus]|uniref:hypothetical protein n=1 Tax=Pseudonocardia lacus TaxID=2835865 RepID=UPI001BDC0C89|nr:hypothetical protein [Pseudonocardia lacus]